METAILIIIAVVVTIIVSVDAARRHAHSRYVETETALAAFRLSYAALRDKYNRLWAASERGRRVFVAVMNHANCEGTEYVAVIASNRGEAARYAAQCLLCEGRMELVSVEDGAEIIEEQYEGAAVLTTFSGWGF